MKQNPVQFQKGLSLTDFLLQYVTEEKCKAALFRGIYVVAIFSRPTAIDN
ncbi:MAG: hypothetical protein G8D59_03660 [gamma proteobacterium symbiont of Phacoides pectinatus]